MLNLRNIPDAAVVINLLFSYQQKHLRVFTELYRSCEIFVIQYILKKFALFRTFASSLLMLNTSRNVRSEYCLSVYPECQYTSIELSMQRTKEIQLSYTEGALATGQGYGRIDLIDVNNEIISVHNLAVQSKGFANSFRIQTFSVNRRRKVLDFYKCKCNTYLYDRYKNAFI